MLGGGLKLHFLLPAVPSPRAGPGVPLSSLGCVGKQERVGLPATPTRQGGPSGLAPAWRSAQSAHSLEDLCPAGSPLSNSANLSTEKGQEVTGRETDAWGIRGPDPALSAHMSLRPGDSSSFPNSALWLHDPTSQEGNTQRHRGPFLLLALEEAYVPGGLVRHCGF